MKTFTKGNLTTVVDDDDFRIAEYEANGWKETETADKPKDEADTRIANAIDAANASEANNKKGKSGKKGKAAAPDKKVNDAVAATATAAAESEAVDDGLIKPSAAKATEGKDNG